jgi:hypothetical protein
MNSNSSSGRDPRMRPGRLGAALGTLALHAGGGNS